MKAARMRVIASRVLSRLGLAGNSKPPGDLPRRTADAWTYVRRNRLTYLSDSRLASLARLAADADRARADAIFIEAGCALGGSTVILSAAKSPSRGLNVYDVFGTIPAPGAKDGADVHQRYEVIKAGRSRGIDGDQYYGYQPDLRATVERNIEGAGFPLSAHRIALVQGLLQDTLAGDEAVALAHIDVDWYDPVRTCLDRIVPRLVPGGVVILDDYRDWSGCGKAVDEYFEAAGRAGFAFDESAGHLVIRRS